MAHHEVSKLNDLIQVCKDGEKGYKDAAESIKDSQLQQLFLTYSQQRAQFATELQQVVDSLGEDPKKSGSVQAALHRTWISTKSTVTGHSDKAVIDECERGEDAAVKAYQEALQENLPAQAQTVVQRQYTQVKEAHDRVSSMKHAGSANA